MSADSYLLTRAAGGRAPSNRARHVGQVCQPASRSSSPASRSSHGRTCRVAGRSAAEPPGSRRRMYGPRRVPFCRSAISAARSIRGPRRGQRGARHRNAHASRRAGGRCPQKKAAGSLALTPDADEGVMAAAAANSGNPRGRGRRGRGGREKGCGRCPSTKHAPPCTPMRMMARQSQSLRRHCARCKSASFLASAYTLSKRRLANSEDCCEIPFEREVRRCATPPPSKTSVTDGSSSCWRSACCCSVRHANPACRLRNCDSANKRSWRGTGPNCSAMAQPQQHQRRGRRPGLPRI